MASYLPCSVLLRPLDFYENSLRAELRLNEDVKSIDLDKKVLTTDKASSVPFDKARLSPLPTKFIRQKARLPAKKPSPAFSAPSFSQLLICTGCSSRRLDSLKGASSSGIFYLRSAADLEAFRRDLFSDPNSFKNLRHVIVGSSFVGMEMASALKKLGVRSVCVVGRVRPTRPHRIG